MYDIIYCDPPWRYNARNNAKTKFGRGVHGHYPILTLSELKEMNIPASDNSALFLWTTCPRLDQALDLMKTWGFEYKTVAFTWLKTNKHNDKPFFGIGYYTKSNAEICLLGIKGKMKPVSNFVSSAIISAREEHSKKPDVVADRIVELFGDRPRLEMFARVERPGWDVFGNEVENSITL